MICSILQLASPLHRLLLPRWILCRNWPDLAFEVRLSSIEHTWRIVTIVTGVSFCQGGAARGILCLLTWNDSYLHLRRLIGSNESASCLFLHGSLSRLPVTIALTLTSLHPWFLNLLILIGVSCHGWWSFISYSCIFLADTALACLFFLRCRTALNNYRLLLLVSGSNICLSTRALLLRFSLSRRLFSYRYSFVFLLVCYYLSWLLLGDRVSGEISFLTFH